MEAISTADSPPSLTAREALGFIRQGRKHTLAMLRRASPKYQMSVCVINTNQILIKWLKDNFGGSITTRKKAKENHKTAYRWVVGDQRAVVILRKVLPFLVIKTPQAKFSNRVHGRIRERRESRSWTR